jgi:hypothetical protein
MQLLLGTEHYGMKVGEIFRGDVRTKRDGIHARWYFSPPFFLSHHIIHITPCSSKVNNWFTYALPPPERGTGMIAMSICLLPMFLFLLFPDLTCIPALNRGGMDWTQSVASKGEMSEVGIALEADGTYCAIYCLSRDRQEALRALMLDVDPSVLFSGDCADLRNTNASRARSLASRKKKKASVKLQFDELENGKWRCNEPRHLA